MHRNRFILAALALGGLVGAAEVRSTLADQQRALEEFRVKAAAARKAQKLEGDRAALVGKYPTPEVEFSQTVEVRGGGERTLVATGQFVPGSLVVVPCEGVEVLSTKVTKERAEARVRVRPDALPNECDLRIYSPVSETHVYVPALRIQGDYVWELKLANGMTTRWKTRMGEESTSLVGQSEWTEKGKSLGTRGLVLDVTGDEVRAAVQISDEELGAVDKVQDANSAELEALSKKMDGLLKKMEAECGKLSGEKQEACFTKYNARMQAFTEEVNAAAQKGQAQADALSSVCTELKLKAVGGKVTGTADNCSGQNAVQVTGTYKPAK